MSWRERTAKVQVGDSVAYSARFLRNIGCHTGDMPQARGTVTGLERMGEITLAVIDWGEWDMPEKVNVKNLSRVTERGVLD